MHNTGRLLKQASNNLSKNFDSFAKPFDLTGMQMSIIDFLGRKAGDDCFQTDIEQEFNIQRSTTTVMLQRMEKKELIKRQVSNQDARKKSVVLTEKGQQLVTKCQEYFQQHEKQFESAFSDEERAIFTKILTYYKNQKEI